MSRFSLRRLSCTIVYWCVISYYLWVIIQMVICWTKRPRNFMFFFCSLFQTQPFTTNFRSRDTRRGPKGDRVTHLITDSEYWARLMQILQQYQVHRVIAFCVIRWMYSVNVDGNLESMSRCHMAAVNTIIVQLISYIVWIRYGHSECDILEMFMNTTTRLFIFLKGVCYEHKYDGICTHRH